MNPPAGLAAVPERVFDQRKWISAPGGIANRRQSRLGLFAWDGRVSVCGRGVQGNVSTAFDSGGG